NGFGLRVPGIVISPYARRGFVDHQVLSFDAYDKFIEDDFLDGQRLDPATDGRPDPRLDVRENASVLGNLVRDFDFNQAPLHSVILPVHPTTTLTGTPHTSASLDPAVAASERDPFGYAESVPAWRPPRLKGRQGNGLQIRYGHVLFRCHESIPSPDLVP